MNFEVVGVFALTPAFRTRGALLILRTRDPNTSSVNAYFSLKSDPNLSRTNLVPFSQPSLEIDWYAKKLIFLVCKAGDFMVGDL